MMWFCKMLAVGLCCTAVAFYGGKYFEDKAWEGKNMGDLCKDGKPWACYLHPNCSMNSLMCFDNVDFEGMSA